MESAEAARALSPPKVAVKTSETEVQTKTQKTNLTTCLGSSASGRRILLLSDSKTKLLELAAEVIVD